MRRREPCELIPICDPGTLPFKTTDDHGDHVFGRLSRITVNTYAGQRGVVDIEREAKLGGRTEHPLALSASVAFEQQYEALDAPRGAMATTTHAGGLGRRRPRWRRQ